MAHSFEDGNHAQRSFDIPRIPLPLVPKFVRRMGAVAVENGFANAVMDTFNAAGIKIDIEGDDLPENGEGLIVAGDHRQRIEPLLVQAAMALSERDASHVLAMPTSFAGRIMQTSGDIGNELVIPVVPSGFSAENKPSLRQPRDFVRRNLHPKTLKVPKEELKIVNQLALRHASEIAQNGTVTIFPTGGDASLPWYRGFGQIVDELSNGSHDNVQVAFMRPDTFSVKRVMASLAARDLGIELPEQRLLIRTKLLGSVGEVFKGQESPKQISDKARTLYRKEFHK